MILEPTSPFRKPSSIDFAINEIIKNQSESLLTVIRTRENIGTLNEKNIFKPIRKNSPRRRQDRSDLYIESSTLYVTKVDFLLKNKSIVSDNWFAIEISKEEAIDINTFFDLDYARYIMQNK